MAKAVEQEHLSTFTKAVTGQKQVSTQERMSAASAFIFDYKTVPKGRGLSLSLPSAAGEF